MSLGRHGIERLIFIHLGGLAECIVAVTKIGKIYIPS